MAYREYIGSRYVPIFGRKNENTVEWDNRAPYEPLTIVMHQGNSYTSRQYVPTGIDISNTDYWIETGNYNAQIEQYREEVLTFDNRITATENTLESIHSTWEYGGTLQPSEYLQENFNIQGLFAHVRKNETLGLLQLDAELILNTAADLPAYNASDPESSHELFTLPEGFRPISNAVMDRGAYCRHGIIGDTTDWYTSFVTFRVNSDGKVYATTAAAVRNANLWGIAYSMFCIPSGQFQ